MENNNVSLAQDAAVQAADLTKPIPQKRKINRAKLQENIWGWIFVSALFIGTTVFTYIAFALSLWISFTDYDAYIMTTFWEGLGSIHPDGFWHWYQFMFTPEGILGIAGESEDFWNTPESTFLAVETEQNTISDPQTL